MWWPMAQPAAAPSGGVAPGDMARDAAHHGALQAALGVGGARRGQGERQGDGVEMETVFMAKSSRWLARTLGRRPGRAKFK